MLTDILLPFLTVGLAEVGDKTQLILISLAGRTSRHGELLMGGICAFAVSTLLIILLGGFIAQHIPPAYLHWLAAAVFIISGLFSLLDSGSPVAPAKLRQPFFSSFGLVLLSEMGDKSQLAAGAFATRFNPAAVAVGAILVLALLSFLAVRLGQQLSNRLPSAHIARASGVLFILIGLAFLAG